MEVWWRSATIYLLYGAICLAAHGTNVFRQFTGVEGRLMPNVIRNQVADWCQVWFIPLVDKHVGGR